MEDFDREGFAHRLSSSPRPPSSAGGVNPRKPGCQLSVRDQLRTEREIPINDGSKTEFISELLKSMWWRLAVWAAWVPLEPFRESDYCLASVYLARFPNLGRIWCCQKVLQHNKVSLFLTKFMLLLLFCFCLVQRSNPRKWLCWENWSFGLVFFFDSHQLWLVQTLFTH